jgi:uncharacterized protein YdeI (YjbR/CyaY-like superfamily)
MAVIAPASLAEWRAWLAANHARASEVWVRYVKSKHGRSIAWSAAVDEALCFGWIDGVRRSLGAAAYSIRCTPRKKASTWSAVNVKRFGELREAGLVAPAGQAAFDRRREERTAIYAYEQDAEAALAPEQEARLRADEAAWAFWTSQPPWYRRTATHWVVRAKREDTRERRLATLIADSAAGRRIGPLSR